MFKNEDVFMINQQDPRSGTITYEALTSLDDDFMLSNSELLLGGSPVVGDLFADAIPHAEETMEAQMKFNVNTFPVSPRGPPSRDVDPGPYNFHVEIDGSNTQKKKYLYSHKLNRIYVNMNCNFSVKFVWDASQACNMLVRACVVFSDLEQAEKRPERCLQHRHVSSNADTLPPHIINNVLRSASDIGAHNVHYCGDHNYPDSWYSVLIRFPAPTAHAYQFVCKNSCSSGINRRPIDILFTLEDDMGKVYGRQTVGIRVCSCPKRDITREEADVKKTKTDTKRPAVNEAPSHVTEAPGTKRIKVETSHDAPVTLPPVQIIGPRVAVAGLRVMLNSMEHAKAIKVAAQQSVDELNKSITELRSTIDNMETTYKLNTL